MICVDTNILLSSILETHPQHQTATAFLLSIDDRQDVAMSEFVLMELYVLLRNPAIFNIPLPAGEAVSTCMRFREHPKWRILGFSQDSRELHDELWSRAGETTWPRRRIYDLRMALTMIHQGVTEFATANVKDFHDAGFRRVWNPLT